MTLFVLLMSNNHREAARQTVCELSLHILQHWAKLCSAVHKNIRFLACGSACVSAPLKVFMLFSEIREIMLSRKVPLTVVPFLIGGI